MQYNIKDAVSILERTPILLRTMLEGLPEEWLNNNEGEDTWSPYDVVGHLVHGERTDWIGRMNIILSDAEDKTFKPFDRFAQFEDSKGKTITMLLDEFAELREQNLNTLQEKGIREEDFARTGIHPAFGEVKLSQLLSTWVVHDLSHIAQISRVMAKQYKEAVGPWQEYLSILK